MFELQLLWPFIGIILLAALGGLMVYAAYVRWTGTDLEQKLAAMFSSKEEIQGKLSSLEERYHQLEVEQRNKYQELKTRFCAIKQERDELQKNNHIQAEQLEIANTKVNMSERVLHDLAHSMDAVHNSLAELKELRSAEDGTNARLQQIREELEIAIDHLAYDTRDIKQFLGDYGLGLDRRLKKTQVDIVKLVDEVRNSRSNIARLRGVSVWQSGENALPKFFGDRDALRRILTNLVDNGIKYADKNYHKNGKSEPEVGIKLSLDDGNVIVIKVSDNGIGMPEGLIQNIWGQAIRIPEKRDFFFKGSGLGLAIVRMYIDAHAGASISVESIEGSGTVFTIYLPVV